MLHDKKLKLINHLASNLKKYVILIIIIVLISALGTGSIHCLVHQTKEWTAIVWNDLKAVGNFIFSGGIAIMVDRNIFRKKAD